MQFGPLRRHLRQASILQSLRLARLGHEARNSGHFDWQSILDESGDEWKNAKLNAHGPRILIASNIGLHFGVSRIDSLLGIALTLRGAKVDFLLCDQALPACMSADTSWFSDNHSKFEQKGLRDNLCRHCFEPAFEKLAHLGLKIHRFSTYLNEQDEASTEKWLNRLELSDPRSIIEEGIPIGEHALSGTLRYLARGTLKEQHTPVLRAYLRAARLTRLAVTRLAKKQEYDAALLHHGIYIPQGTVAAVLKKNGVRIATWFPSYRKKCFIFSHEDTYHRTMLSEPTRAWEEFDFDAEKKRAITTYLKSRWTGSNDWIFFQRKPEFDFYSFSASRGLNANKPLIGLLTNVFWDAQLHYPESSFSSMREWLVETVRYFGERKDLQLVIRVHPAEVTGAMPARETALSILDEEFDKLPDNVFVVGPKETISTYILASHCKACLIYATKAGIELLSMGIPVIAAGEAWVKGKQMALDANSWESYFEYLKKLPLISPPDNYKTRALRYAYHFFFRRMIPLQAVKPVKSWPPYAIDIEKLSELGPGVEAGLDVICNGILNAEPFIYPAEYLGESSDGYSK